MKKFLLFAIFAWMATIVCVRAENMPGDTTFLKGFYNNKLCVFVVTYSKEFMKDNILCDSVTGLRVGTEIIWRIKETKRAVVELPPELMDISDHEIFSLFNYRGYYYSSNPRDKGVERVCYDTAIFSFWWPKFPVRVYYLKEKVIDHGLMYELNYDIKSNIESNIIFTLFILLCFSIICHLFFIDARYKHKVVTNFVIIFLFLVMYFGFLKWQMYFNLPTLLIVLFVVLEAYYFFILNRKKHSVLQRKPDS